MGDVARHAAGTFIPDEAGQLPPALYWITCQLRAGSLAEYVRSFCAGQIEILDPSLVLCESVTRDEIQCRITCRCYDHESTGAFSLDVLFTLNPVTGEARRTG